ncbi:hypothetical protein [Actinoplanes sp. NPDC051851]|uniref:hypothetical protein n=1 Tax=Actinoplanes sp. NPDC051851 TaxID=3154753 RepID=UPI00342406FE
MTHPDHTPPELPQPRTTHPLGTLATVLRSPYGSPGSLSDTTEFVITAIATPDGALTALPVSAHVRRLTPDRPEAWLCRLDVIGRTTWSVIPAMPAEYQRTPAAVRHYLSGWMASGNYAHLPSPAALVGFDGAIAIHDHREWPPALPTRPAAP